ncbi:MAG: hypothetical protein ACPGED_05515, partial [Flavobacteriales bacterium]
MQTKFNELENILKQQTKEFDKLIFRFNSNVTGVRKLLSEATEFQDTIKVFVCIINRYSIFLYVLLVFRCSNKNVKNGIFPNSKQIFGHNIIKKETNGKKS